MKKLPIFIFALSVVMLAGLTSFSIKKENNLSPAIDQRVVDSSLLPVLPLEITTDDPFYANADYTVCTSETCYLARLPEVLPEEPIVLGEAYTVCTSDNCFLAIISEIQENFGMLLYMLEDKNE